jgi:hypothetical protein
MQENNAPTVSGSANLSSFERLLSPATIVDVVDAQSARRWFVRLHITGMHPRRFGPFESRAGAETFLLDALERVLELMVEALPALAERVTGRTELPILEDELGEQYLARMQ